MIRTLTALLAAAFIWIARAPAAAAAQSAPFDVIVVGGTPAGVAAAVSAARHGQNVELVIRRDRLGGILTDAMMDQWDLNLARDGRSIEGGIFSEIYAQVGDSFTPAQAAAAFERLVAREPRIRVVRDAQPIAAETMSVANLRTVTGVTFRDAHDGHTFDAVAPYVIDATDDGDVGALAGARYTIGRQDTGRDERTQPVTLMFTIEGVDWPRVVTTYDATLDGPGGAMDRRAWGYDRLMRAYVPASGDVLVRDLNLGHEDGGSVTVNAIDVLGIDGLIPADIARARVLTQREAPRLVAFLRRSLPGFENARLGRFAQAVYVRETRHFAGMGRLTADDVWSGSVPEDTIGLSSYPLDLHPSTAQERAAFAPVRHVYGVPFGAMVPRGFGNLALASPAISASHLASGSARVIPTTIEEGEAAGTAAAIASQRAISFAAIASADDLLDVLQGELAQAGVVLPVSDARAVSRARTADRRA
ncbi:MAG: hypothetical protein NVSMB64_11570 [Candidatus Velthaea sp.]